MSGDTNIDKTRYNMLLRGGKYGMCMYVRMYVQTDFRLKHSSTVPMSLHKTNEVCFKFKWWQPTFVNETGQMDFKPCEVDMLKLLMATTGCPLHCSPTYRFYIRQFRHCF